MIVIEDKWWPSEIHYSNWNVDFSWFAFTAGIDSKDASKEFIAFWQVHSDVLTNANWLLIDLLPEVISSSELNKVAGNLSTTAVLRFFPGK